ncbi:hypothetical protein NZNM25_05040 [Nitrosopumilus zosterae]|uniref:Uncharacterized protein n=1 Tax=Nitrosopumilus zosterae TaxID=718286 RepID=A0A2S2KPX9_9ARCH|nr:hypothetical protein NZNM25_05040 [Nitrosopumilus zosterae]
MLWVNSNIIINHVIKYEIIIFDENQILPKRIKDTLFTVIMGDFRLNYKKSTKDCDLVEA